MAEGYPPSLAGPKGEAWGQAWRQRGGGVYFDSSNEIAASIVCTIVSPRLVRRASILVFSSAETHAWSCTYPASRYFAAVHAVPLDLWFLTRFFGTSAMGATVTPASGAALLTCL